MFTGWDAIGTECGGVNLRIGSCESVHLHGGLSISAQNSLPLRLYSPLVSIEIGQGRSHQRLPSALESQGPASLSIFLSWNALKVLFLRWTAIATRDSHHENWRMC